MAECPECGAKVKAAPGKRVVCPKCDTKFRVPDDEAAEAAPARKGVKAAIKKEAAKPAVSDDMYGFSKDEVDLAELRDKRETAEKEREAERKKKEKPIIEVRRKNIGDLAVWERIDKSMIWFLAGVATWGAAHGFFGLILFLGMIQGPEYAGPVVTRLIRPNQPPIELGAGDALDRPSFVIAMLGGSNLYTITLVLLILIQVLGWARCGLWMTGYAIAWPSAPRDVSGQGQLIALYSLGGLNVVFAFFLVFLPLVGAYSYICMPWSGAEIAMAEFNMERALPLHVFWAYAPFWETFLAFLLMTMIYAEPILIAYFVWSVASVIKEEPLAKASLGTVKMGFSVLFLLLTYQLFALAGTSPVLVQVLRVLYVVWYGAMIVWFLRLASMTVKCRETFRFYFHPDED